MADIFDLLYADYGSMTEDEKAATNTAFTYL